MIFEDKLEDNFLLNNGKAEPRSSTVKSKSMDQDV
jgi:hypothetical protein